MRMHHIPIRRVLLAVALVLAIGGPAARAGASVRAIPEPVGAPTPNDVGSSHDLDVAGVLPISFVPASEGELAAAREALGPDVEVGQYTSTDGSAIAINLRTLTRLEADVVEVGLHDPTSLFEPDDLTAALYESGIPPEDITMAPPEWSEVAMGDLARRGVYRFDVRDVGSMQLDVLAALVPSGSKSVYVEIKYVHPGDPVLEVVTLGEEVAARVAADNGSRHRTVLGARAGLLTLANVPPVDWSEKPQSGDAPGGDGSLERAARRVGRSDPECEGLAGAFGDDDADAGQQTRGGDVDVEGPHLQAGPSGVDSSVHVYAREEAARAELAVARRPSTRRCLEALYAEGIAPELEGQGIDVEVDVQMTVEPAPVGDDAVRFQITITGGAVPIVQDLEFVRVERALATYAFTNVGEPSPLRAPLVEQAAARLAERLP